MIFKETGKIGNQLYMLGHPTFPVYFLGGSCPVIFDAGLSIMGPRYVQEFRNLLTKRTPAYLLLTHSHFDHCGSAAFFKKTFPGMEIVASANARKILERPNALQLIKELNRKSRSLAGGLGIAPPYESFEPFPVDRVVADGDILQLSDALSIRVLETPGHTRDSLSFFVQEERILVAAEALGVPNASGYITSDFLSGYDAYVASMERLEKLAPEILCLAHYKAFSGSDVGNYIQESMARCREFKDLLELCLLEEQGDADRVMKRIRKIEYDGQREDIQTEDAYCLNLAARIRAVTAGDGREGTS